VKILIENLYLDGHKCSEVIELPHDPGLLGFTEDAIEEWWNDYVFDFTGCGHGAPENTPDGRTMDATYTATIIEADDPLLIGKSYDWSG